MKDYVSKNFHAHASQQGDRVLMTQQIFHPAIHTGKLPSTLSMLSEHIPSIFKNTCYNAKNLTFKKEAKDTQVGHLFEHIILENLKIMSVKNKGYGHFRGETTWNWHKEKVGKYNIVVFSDKKNFPQFSEAFDDATNLLEKIYQS